MFSECGGPSNPTPSQTRPCRTVVKVLLKGQRMLRLITWCQLNAVFVFFFFSFFFKLLLIQRKTSFALPRRTDNSCSLKMPALRFCHPPLPPPTPSSHQPPHPFWKARMWISTSSDWITVAWEQRKRERDRKREGVCVLRANGAVPFRKEGLEEEEDCRLVKKVPPPPLKNK